MPRAECDLAAFMKETTSRVDAHSWGFRWLVRQLVGLVEGLHAVHNPGPVGRGRQEERMEVAVGYHWDIKPENILVTFPPDSNTTSETSDTSASGTSGKEKAPIFQLTDFGCGGVATFCPHQSPGSDIRKMSNVGNTEYKAPEKQAPERKCGRDYDVWSLGGVMLEVLVWYFHGMGEEDEDDDADSDSSVSSESEPDKEEENEEESETVARSSRPQPSATGATHGGAVLDGEQRTMGLKDSRKRRGQEKKAAEKGTKWAGIEYAGFFIHSSDREPGDATLVPSVKRVMEEIQKTAAAVADLHMEGRERRALGRLLEVIQGMLVVDREARLTAREAKVKMKGVWREVDGDEGEV